MASCSPVRIISGLIQRSEVDKLAKFEEHTSDWSDGHLSKESGAQSASREEIFASGPTVSSCPALVSWDSTVQTEDLPSVEFI